MTHVVHDVDGRMADGNGVGGAHPSPDVAASAAGLQRLALWTAGGLAAVAAFSATALVLALATRDGAVSPMTAAWVGLAAGALGSAVAALLSLSERVAAGWELDDGSKWPRDGGSPARFNRRMWLLFAQRPLLGAFVGLMVVLALVGGVRADIAGDEIVILAFWVGTVGFFAKTVLESLKAMVKGLVGGR
jgi:hypothetical protein